MNRRAALALLLAAPASVRAQGIDLSGGGPVEVTATDGIEWRQAEQLVIARGEARAIRDGVTVDADRLIARYRPPAGAAAPASGETGLGAGGEIWRLEAEGRVRIASATDRARGDRAVYDIDQAVLVLTGRDLGLDTPQQRISANESLEYWSARRFAVARGGAVVIDTVDNRRIAADTLVAYFLDPGAAPAAATPGTPGSGKLDRVEAFGRVEIRTPLETVRGDRGVYSAATGMARLLGAVRITRGDNQLNGREAIVNLRTGVARLVGSPGARVQGLVMPEAGAAPR